MVRVGGVFHVSIRPLPQSIRELIDEMTVQVEQELLLVDVHSRSNVFVDGFGRNGESFSEDVEKAITPDETDQVIASGLGFRQRMLWRLVAGREPESSA